MLKSRPKPRLLCRKLCIDGSRCNRPVERPGGPCGVQHASPRDLFDTFTSPISVVSLENRDISGQDFSWKSAEYQNIAGLVARGAGLYQANLCHCSAPAYAAPVFDTADMKQSGLEGATLPSSSFRGADLSEAILDEGVFLGCTFDGAILNNMHANNANFRGSSFQGVTAHQRTVLYNCQLTNVDARGADLTGVVFSRSSLRGMDLRGAVGLNLTPGVMECIVYDENTLWPAGFVPPTAVEPIG